MIFQCNILILRLGSKDVKGVGKFTNTKKLKVTMSPGCYGNQKDSDNKVLTEGLNS